MAPILGAMRSVWLALFVLLLAWALVPGGAELAENAYHLAVHGDFAHSEPLGQSHRPFGSEHGCGGGFHLCSCCHTQPTVSEEKQVLASSRLSTERLSTGALPSVARGFARGLEEPPRA